MKRLVLLLATLALAGCGGHPGVSPLYGINSNISAANSLFTSLGSMGRTLGLTGTGYSQSYRPNYGYGYGYATSPAYYSKGGW